jgi:hypothetical protein
MENLKNKNEIPLTRRELYFHVINMDFYIPSIKSKSFTNKILQGILSEDLYCIQNPVNDIQFNIKLSAKKIAIQLYKFHQLNEVVLWFNKKELPSKKYMLNYLYKINPENIIFVKYNTTIKMNYTKKTAEFEEHFNKYLIEKFPLNRELDEWRYFFHSYLDISPFEISEDKSTTQLSAIGYDKTLLFKEMILMIIFN